MLIERKEILNEDGSIGYVESLFKSDNILKTTYFPSYNRLYIAFNRGGRTYSYANITPELYKEFEEAESTGKFFNSRINKNPNYSHRLEFTLYPNEMDDIKKIINEATKQKDSTEDNG